MLPDLRLSTAQQRTSGQNLPADLNSRCNVLFRASCMHSCMGEDTEEMNKMEERMRMNE
jgi:hypothetical protein